MPRGRASGRLIAESADAVPQGLGMLTMSRRMESHLLLSAAVLCALLAVVAIFAHLLAVHAERHRAHAKNLAVTAQVGAAAIEATVPERSLAATRERFTIWSRSVMSDSAIVGSALLNSQGLVLELQPVDLADRAAMAEVLARGGGRIDLGYPMGPLDVSLHNASQGLRIVLFARPLEELAGFAELPWSLVLIIAAAFCFVLILLRALFERSVVKPLRALIELTAANVKPPYRRQYEGTGFSQLTRNITGLIEDHKNTRGRLGQLKRTMDSRVAHQTRQIEAMLKRAERQAWIDPLTGLGNRRLLNDRLESLVANHLSQNDDLSVILFDLDNFKGLNDSLGHAAGDELLSFVGELLRGSLRSSDIGLRLGGDEFAILLLGTSVEQAAESADRLIKLFGQRASLFDVHPRVTLSAGVASIKHHRSANGEELLAAADTGLYRAKRSGKSCVGIVPRSLVSARSLP